MWLGDTCAINMGRVKQLSSETISNIIALKNAGKQTKELSEQLKLYDQVVRRYVARWKGEDAALYHPRKSRLVGLVRLLRVWITF